MPGCADIVVSPRVRILTGEAVLVTTRQGWFQSLKSLVIARESGFKARWDLSGSDLGGEFFFHRLSPNSRISGLYHPMRWRGPGSQRERLCGMIKGN